MKQLFSILLSTLILVLATKDIGTYAAFKLNQTFIANNWCININNSEVDCSGKCFLKNELKENQESKEDNSKLPSLEESTENYYYSNLKNIKTGNKSQYSSSNFGYFILESQLFTFQSLDPPEVRLT